MFFSHLNLLSTVLCLLAGAGAIAAFQAKIRRFNGSPLRYLLGYLVFFNLIELQVFVLSYFKTNLPSTVWNAVLHLLKGIDFPLRTVLLLFMYGCLFQTIAWLREVALSKGFRIGLIAYMAGMAGWFWLAMRFTALMPESPYLTYWNMLCWPVQGMLAFFLIRLLLANRRQADAGRRRMVEIFAWLWLGQILLGLAQSGMAMIPHPIGWLIFSKGLALYTNLAPVAWLIYFYTPWAGSLSKVIANRVDLTNLKQIHGLSDREMEVLTLMIDGKSYKEIEAALFISIHTVKTHVYNMYRKLGVNSRHQLVHYLTTQQDSG